MSLLCKKFVVTFCAIFREIRQLFITSSGHTDCESRQVSQDQLPGCFIWNVASSLIVRMRILPEETCEERQTKEIVMNWVTLTNRCEWGHMRLRPQCDQFWCGYLRSQCDQFRCSYLNKYGNGTNTLKLAFSGIIFYLISYFIYNWQQMNVFYKKCWWLDFTIWSFGDRPAKCTTASMWYHH